MMVIIVIGLLLVAFVLGHVAPLSLVFCLRQSRGPCHEGAPKMVRCECSEEGGGDDKGRVREREPGGAESEGGDRRNH